MNVPTAPFFRDGNFTSDDGIFTMTESKDRRYRPTGWHSIRYRVLGPIILTSLFMAIFVAGISYFLGWRRARADVEHRFQTVREVVLESGFPLSDTVLKLISRMTATELQTLTEHGIVIDETLAAPLSGEDLANRYQAFLIELRTPPAGIKPASTIRVLFDRRQLQATTRNAALMPLATGISTLVVLSSITLLITNQLVERLLNLQRKVATIASRQLGPGQPSGVASGSMHSSSESSAHRKAVADDELGKLETAVDGLTNQLQQLWHELRSKQSEQLLYQLASGMAHQLRNSLTGARMAIELHAGKCPLEDRKTLDVAVNQILQTDGYVQRLLMVGKRKLDSDHPGSILNALDQVRVGMETIASHRAVELAWKFNPDRLIDYWVADIQLFADALSNLILNAIEAGKHVQVQIDRRQQNLISEVIDDGPGVASQIADNIVEPFVTSKPEGLGLGLSLAQRTANNLGGKLEWERRREQTVFSLTIQCFDKDSISVAASEEISEF
jgi:signal transduction histidine kinase